jgi:hypothetical protein
MRQNASAQSSRRPSGSNRSNATYGKPGYWVSKGCNLSGLKIFWAGELHELPGMNLKNTLPDYIHPA